jgi:hypothetical protein
VQVHRLQGRKEKVTSQFGKWCPPGSSHASYRAVAPDALQDWSKQAETSAGGVLVWHVVTRPVAASRPKLPCRCTGCTAKKDSRQTIHQSSTQGCCVGDVSSTAQHGLQCKSGASRQTHRAGSEAVWCMGLPVAASRPKLPCRCTGCGAHRMQTERNS